MLAGGRTPQFQCPFHDGIDHPIDLIPFFFVALFACDNQVNVAVTGVAERITDNVVRIDLAVDGFYQFRVLAIWHRHIR